MKHKLTELTNLVNLVIENDLREEQQRASYGLKSIELTPRQLNDLELLAIGAFSPLTTFLSSRDYQSVINNMRLADETLWPVPILLQVDQKVIESIKLSLNDEIVLRDSFHSPLAIIKVEEIFEINNQELSQKLLGKDDHTHPYTEELLRTSNICISGPLKVFQLPNRFRFHGLKKTPLEVRAEINSKLEKRTDLEGVVAFQTRNPIHRSHEQLIKNFSAKNNLISLIHPVVGITRDEDISPEVRVETYKTLTQNYFDQSQSILGLIPLAMRFAGPKEAVWHQIIRKNYGATHFIVGRDHAGPGKDKNGEPFFSEYAAQELSLKYQDEIGIKVLISDELVYAPKQNVYISVKKATEENIEYLTLSGTAIRKEYLAKGQQLPEWFTRPEISKILTENTSNKISKHRGACVWLTGLPSSGKSTTAEALEALLVEQGTIVTLLDGDVVRRHLSEGLGFSQEDRNKNILRIGFVASEIVKHGGTVICSLISPYLETRKKVRELMPNGAKFIEVFVDTPLATCEERDVKGLYQKAKNGEIKGLTGIDDAYQKPINPEITLNTVEKTPEENAQVIYEYIKGI